MQKIVVTVDGRAETFKTTVTVKEFLELCEPFRGVAVFPCPAVLNSFLMQGVLGGGMSDRISWSPFSLSDAEYWELVSQVEDDPSPLFDAPFVVDYQNKTDLSFHEWIGSHMANHRRR